MKNKTQELINLGLIYLASISFGTILFLALFWINFNQISDVLFFKSFIYLIVVSIFLVITLALIKSSLVRFRFLTFRDIFLISIIFFTLNNILYGLVPFNTSRSVSVMIVGYLYNHQDSSVTKGDIDTYIYQLYFKQDDAVQRRLLEQVKVGNVEKIGDAYKLTPKGIRTVRLMGIITSAYNTDKNYAQ